MRAVRLKVSTHILAAVTYPHLPGWGAAVRILFESRPLFRVHPGATNQPVIELDDGVGFLWVWE